MRAVSSYIFSQDASTTVSIGAGVSSIITIASTDIGNAGGDDANAEDTTIIVLIISTKQANAIRFIWYMYHLRSILKLVG